MTGSSDSSCLPHLSCCVFLFPHHRCLRGIGCFQIVLCTFFFFCTFFLSSCSALSSLPHFPPHILEHLANLAVEFSTVKKLSFSARFVLQGFLAFCRAKACGHRFPQYRVNKTKQHTHRPTSSNKKRGRTIFWWHHVPGDGMPGSKAKKRIKQNEFWVPNRKKNSAWPDGQNACMDDSLGRLRRYRCSNLINYDSNLFMPVCGTFLIRLLPSTNNRGWLPNPNMRNLRFEFEYSDFEHLVIVHPTRDFSEQRIVQSWFAPIPSPWAHHQNA